jgi:uncharacterized protein YbjT (DUF2867 family)
MKTITIFGGSGFVGRYLVQKFAEEGHLIRVAVRNPIAGNFLKPLGEVGQITLVQASILSPEDIFKSIQGADIVVNLVGILYEKKNQTFESIHVEGARCIAEIASKMGISRLLHMSALGANKDSPSRYASTKARGEEAVLSHFPQATLFRPSVIFGPEDAFLNRFAEMARYSPFLPLIGGGKARFQPVYVGDVAESFVNASFNRKAPGETFELGGPQIYSFKDLMIYLLKTIHRKRILLPLPFPLAKMMGFFAEFLPTPPLTRDQVRLLKSDTVVSPHALTIEDLKVSPKALEVIAPLYLHRYRPQGRPYE